MSLIWEVLERWIMLDQQDTVTYRVGFRLQDL